MLDHAKKIAVLRITKVWVAGKQYELLRAVTWAEKSEDRVLLGYFPPDMLALAAAVVWEQWVKVHPSVSNRR